jgi:hypothetical protein
MIQGIAFCEEIVSVFRQLLKYHKKSLLGDFNIKPRTKKFSIQQSLMRDYIKLLMIMILEY